MTTVYTVSLSISSPRNTSKVIGPASLTRTRKISRSTIASVSRLETSTFRRTSMQATAYSPTCMLSSTIVPRESLAPQFEIEPAREYVCAISLSAKCDNVELALVLCQVQRPLPRSVTIQFPSRRCPHTLALLRNHLDSNLSCAVMFPRIRASFCEGSTVTV